jgi:hypothetical protein
MLTTLHQHDATAALAAARVSGQDWSGSLRAQDVRVADLASAPVMAPSSCTSTTKQAKAGAYVAIAARPWTMGTFATLHRHRRLRLLTP